MSVVIYVCIGLIMLFCAMIWFAIERLNETIKEVSVKISYLTNELHNIRDVLENKKD